MKRALVFLLALGLGISGATVRAQSNVTRIIVPFGAGGVQEHSRALDRRGARYRARPNVIVENRTGAGGTIGTASVAKAAPDGHTLILSAASHTINGSLYREAVLRSDPGLHRPFAHIRHRGVRADDHCRAAGEDGEGVRGLRQGQSGKAQLQPPPAAVPRRIFRWRTLRVSPASTWCTCRTRATNEAVNESRGGPLARG